MKRKQTKLESAARDHNWLLGRLTSAEKQFNAVICDALLFADHGPIQTRLTFQKAASSMARFARDRVSDRFAAVKRSELLREQIVEPTQDFSISKEQ